MMEIIYYHCCNNDVDQQKTLPRKQTPSKKCQGTKLLHRCTRDYVRMCQSIAEEANKNALQVRSCNYLSQLNELRSHPTHVDTQGPTTSRRGDEGGRASVVKGAGAGGSGGSARAASQIRTLSLLLWQSHDLKHVSITYWILRRPIGWARHLSTPTNNQW